jgi:hypothetical protein
MKVPRGVLSSVAFFGPPHRGQFVNLHAAKAVGGRKDAALNPLVQQRVLEFFELRRYRAFNADLNANRIGEWRRYNRASSS